MIVDNIKYAVSYNKRFYVRLILFQYYNKWYVKSLTVGGILSLMICIGYLFSFNPIGFHSFPYFALFYSILVAFLPLYLIFKIHRSIKNQALFHQKIHFDINSTRINILLGNEEKNILWNQIDRVQDHSKAWLVFGTSTSFFYLPKDSLSLNQQDLLMKWIVESSKFSH